MTTEPGTPAVLSQLYTRVFQAMLVVAALSYGSYLVLFLLLGVPVMPVVNAVATLLCVAAVVALRRGFVLVATVLIGVVVLGHAVPATHVLGWDASFHLFTFVFLVFFVLNPAVGLPWKIGVIALVTAGYLAVEASSQGQAPLVPASTRTVFKLLNLVMFSGVLSFLAVLYSSAMWKTTEGLHRANALLGTAERNLREVFRLSPVAMVLSRLSDQRLLAANHRAEALFGVTMAKVRGRPAQDFWVRPEDRAALREGVQANGRVEGLEVELKKRSGATFWAELSAGQVDYDGEPALLVTCVDVTERRHTAAVVRDSERTLRTLLNAAPVPFVVTGLHDGVVRYCNPRAAELFELPTQELVGRSAPEFYVNPEDRAAFLEELHRAGEVTSFSAKLKTRSGKEQWLVLAARTFELHDEQLFIVGFADISKQKELENQLRELATTDALTGALNRRQLFEVGEAELRRADRYGHPTSIVMFDADDFKRINDELGHSAGDQALRQLVGLIREQVRTSDTVARYGGEEFVLLLPETNLDAALTLTERIRAAVEARGFTATGHSRRLTVSAGVSVARAGETLGAVLSRVDTALYDAKNSGRNRVVRAA